MTKFVKKLMGLVIGLSLVAGVGIGAATLGSKDVKVEAANATYSEATIAAGKKVLIVTKKSSNYYILAAATTTSNPKVVACTVSSSSISGDFDANLFTVGGSDGAWTFTNSNGKKLYETNNNSGLRVGDTSDTWSLTSKTNGFAVQGKNNSRYIGVYGTSDWRSYTTSNASNYDGSGEAIKFYERDSIHTTGVEVTPETTTMVVGGEKQLTVTLSPEGATDEITYSSSSDAVATVSSDGLITAVSAGTATITATSNGFSDTCAVTVLSSVTRVDLPKGDYPVNIDYSKVKKGDVVPASKDYEIKENAGSTFYKNMTISYTDVVASYDSEYTFSGETSTAVLTNNSNAIVKSIEIKYFNSSRLVVKDNDGEIISGSGSSNVYTYVINNDSFSLEYGSYASSIYYIKVNFNVTTEVLYSVTVGGIATKLDYLAGSAPSVDGLTATANYTEDGGQTISRSEDVTSLAVFNCNPTTLALSDTSFSVTATYAGITSAAKVVSGVTVRAGIEINTETFPEISTTGYATTYTHSYTVGASKVNMEAYGVYKNGGIQVNKDKGTYIKNTTAIPGYITSIVIEWKVSGKNSINMYANSCGVASTDSTLIGEGSSEDITQTFTITDPATANYNYFYFDGTPLTGSCVILNMTINYTAVTAEQELSNWSKGYYASLKSGETPICKGQGSTDTAALKTAWDEQASMFADLSSDAKALAKTGAALETGTDTEKALYLYDYCTSHYADTVCSRFITDRAVSSLVGQNRFINLNSDYSIGIILVIAFISVSSITAFILVKKYKRRHE